ncbi:MAG: hypothetical protein JO011_16680, partial [Ktedonobacteraceae bacterium]|nr:hypothetical protein [Ktedonobacteraceae bacterium]
MGNEGQQPPSTGQEAPEQQGYYGWQYDQDDGGQVQQSPAIPPAWSYAPPHPPSQPLPPPVQPPVNYQQAPVPGGRQPQLRPQYQEPIRDMGTSLGYGQGMEYQYFDTPQPSQPIAQLRQERLQQLREERMRRQQRRMVGPDITSLLPWSAKRS